MDDNLLILAVLILMIASAITDYALLDILFYIAAGALFLVIVSKGKGSGRDPQDWS